MFSKRPLRTQEGSFTHIDQSNQMTLFQSKREKNHDPVR